jgi:hypothetical protein
VNLIIAFNERWTLFLRCCKTPALDEKCIILGPQSKDNSGEDTLQYIGFILSGLTVLTPTDAVRGDGLARFTARDID